jgi:AcrR family transcriptional regulator
MLAENAEASARGDEILAIPDGSLVRAPRMRAAERRAQLAHLAARRFHQLGYHGVSLDLVATEAGVTGPAVYRHFRNKQALLAAAISSGLDLVEDALLRTTGGTLSELVAAVAEAGLERPDLWVLLQRESRYLEPELRAQVDAQFARIIGEFVRRVRHESPALSDEDARLLVTAATAVLSSPGMTSTVLPRADYRRELSAAALVCLRFDLSHVKPTASRHDEPATPPASPSRRTEIVDAATDLFYHRGYTAVSLDDIGAAIGIAGPSILHHFPIKSDILVAAFDRATTSLGDAHRRREAGQTVGMNDPVSAYVEFCLRNRALIGVYISDAVNLPADALRRTQEIIKEDVAEWSAQLRAVLPTLDERRARLRVRAAMAAIHDLVRLGHFASRPRIADETTALAQAILLR